MLYEASKISIVIRKAIANESLVPNKLGTDQVSGRAPRVITNLRP